MLLVLAATAAALLIAGVTSGGKQRTGGAGGAGLTPTGAEVELTGAQDFDPEGGDGEHSDEVGLAIDGIPNTAWPTETYTAGPDLSLSGKSGVGLIVEAADPVTGQSLTVGTPTGGWRRDRLRLGLRAADRPRRLGRAGRLDHGRRPEPGDRPHRPVAGALLPDLVHEARRGQRRGPGRGQRRHPERGHVDPRTGMSARARSARHRGARGGRRARGRRRRSPRTASRRRSSR